MALTTWLAGASLAIAGPPPAEKLSSPEARRAISIASGQALQGQIRPALAALRAVPATLFNDKDRATRDCLIARFETGRDEGPASGLVTGRALLLYRAYWRASLLEPGTRDVQEKRLIKKLGILLGLASGAGPAEVEARLRQRIIAEGHHVLMGRTPPLMEFMVWSRQSPTLRRVRLPEGQRAVTVKLLDGFTSLGWSAYATCDRSFTGGWVKPDGIYAVGPGWKDLTAENFHVSFLAHETQHFADKERFGELQSWELEYRAKLAELALADVTIPRILAAFISNQGNDPSVPHTFANRIVLSWLVSALDAARPEALAEVAPEKIRQAARSLLFRDSAMRTKLRAVARPPG